MLRPRIILLILLLPLAALWWCVATFVPFASWPGLNPFRDGKHFSLSHHIEGWEDFLILNVETKQVRRALNPLEGYPPDNGLGWSYGVKLLSTDKAESTIQLTVYSHEENRTLRSMKINIPTLATMRPLVDRYMVFNGNNEIRWLDVTDPSETMHTISATSAKDSWIVRHPRLPIFRRTASVAVPPQNKNPPQSITELFRIDEAGQLKSLASWPHATSGYNPILGDAQFHDDKIFSLDVTGRMIEVRSIPDCQLIKTIELPPPFDITQHVVGFADCMLFIQKGTAPSLRERQYYCLTREKWLVPPFEVEEGWTKAAMDLSDDSNIALWIGRDNSNNVSLTDPATNQLLCRVAEPGDRYAFLDNRTLISISPWFGLTVRQHDLSTGATLWTWRPFWWSLPAFAIALAISIAWVSYWLRLPRNSSLWAWLDLHVLLCWLMALIVLRVHVAGTPTAVYRLPYQHAIYIASGFQVVALAWLILGSGSVVSRLSQLLIVQAIVFGSLSTALSAQPHVAWTGAALVSIPSLLSLPLFVLARIRGWKWPSPADSSGSREAIARAELVTLRQLLMVTAVCAVLSLVVRPILPGIGGIFQLQWPIWRAVIITLCGLLGVCLATASNARLKHYGWCLAIGALSLLLAEALITALYTGWWQPLWLSRHEDETRYALGIYLVCFLATNVLRVSGKANMLSMACPACRKRVTSPKRSLGEVESSP